MAAKDKEAAALPEGQAEKPKKKSRAKKIVILLCIILMLGALGGGAYWWFFMKPPASEMQGEEPKVEETQPTQPAEQAAQQPAGNEKINNARIERPADLPRSTGMVLPLPPITVNLSDPGGRRYLKLGMEVEVNSDVSAELKAKSARIRDAVIMLLAGKSYGDIATPDGKVLLKAEIAARLNQILGAPKVVRVYLTDFVVE